MTHHELRQLLSERVEHETPVDLTARAWEAGRRQRRRRAGVLAAGAAAAVAIAAVAVPTLGDDGPRRAPGDPAAPTANSSPSVAQVSGARVGAYAVSYAPTVGQEAGLPDFTGDRAGFPAEIDLSADAPSAETDPLPRAQLAVAVYGERGIERTLLVLGDQVRTLDLPGEPAAEMLSPDGRFLQVARNRQVWVFDVQSGTWTTFTAMRVILGWQADHRLDISGGYCTVEGKCVDQNYIPFLGGGEPPQLGERAQFYGQEQWTGSTLNASAQAIYTDVDVPMPDGSTQTNPEAIVVTRPIGNLLVFSYEPGGGRWNQCCPVAGWLPGGELAFESRHADARLLTWRPGTADFAVLSRFVGWTPGEQTWIASYAQFE